MFEINGKQKPDQRLRFFFLKKKKIRLYNNYVYIILKSYIVNYGN